MEDTLEAAISKLDASDGFYIQEFTVPQPEGHSDLCLYIGFRLGGEEADLPGSAEGSSTICLRKWSDPGEHDFGECARMRLVLQAVCRYVNTGGSLNKLSQMLSFAGMAIRDIDFDFGGCKLAESSLVESDYLHLFTRPDSSSAVSWWENNSIEVIQLEGETLDASTDVQKT